MQSALSASDRRSAPLPVTFFRIPCALMTDARFSDLSAEAKLLYGLLLDRVSLSEKNGWRDEAGCVYIYFKVGEIGRALGCGKDKALCLLRELESGTGAGLIVRVRQGLGRPSRIYVRLPEDAAPSCPAVLSEAAALPQIASEEAEPGSEDTAALSAQVLPSPGEEELPAEDEPGEIDETDGSGETAQPSRLSDGGVCACRTAVLRPSGSAGIRPQEVGFSDLLKSVFPPSGRRLSRSPEVSFSAPNQIEYNQTEFNQTEFNQIDPSIFPPTPRRGAWERERRDAEERLREQIEYGLLLERYGSDAEFTLEILTETAISRAQSIRIGGEQIPAEAVKARFSLLNYEHIDFVLSSLRESRSRIKNLRGYLLTALYRAPSTMDAWYDALVRHDYPL